MCSLSVFVGVVFVRVSGDLGGAVLKLFWFFFVLLGAILGCFFGYWGCM